jgi:hypothetical protein
MLHDLLLYNSTSKIGPERDNIDQGSVRWGLSNSPLKHTAPILGEVPLIIA